MPKSDNIADLDSANKARYEYQILQYIPPGIKYPGTSPDDAALNKEQLYQLQDQDIAAGEEILCEEFKKEIVPIQFYNISEKEIKDIKHYKKISGKKENKEVEYIAIKYDNGEELDALDALNEHKESLEKNERKVEVFDNHSSLHKIYLVPINPAQAVLVDQKKELELKQQRNSKLWAYNEFKNKIRLTCLSLPLANNGVIAGVCNLDGHHYVPYFIYQDKNGKFFVLTIDPSYETSPMLKDCFTDIFPECEYQDARIVQQVRQRDCGFNSLESIRAIAASLQSAKPILTIIDDKLRFNSKGLTVNGEPFKGFDYNRNSHYFLQEFIEQGEYNRKRWAVKFKKKNQVNYGGDFVLEYNYDNNVESQQTSDEMEGLVSVIAAILIDAALLEAYHAQYKEKLELPSAKQIEKIKEKLLETGFNFNDALEDKAANDAILAIYKMNYKKDTAIGLLNIFKNGFLQRALVNKDSTPESFFHEFTQTEKYIEYSKIIPESEREELRKKALQFAHDKIKKEVFKLKQAFILSYLHENMEKLLKSIEIDPDSALIANSIIVALRENKETHEDMSIILEEVDNVTYLLKYIATEISQLVEKKINYYYDYLEKNPALFQHQELIEKNEVNIFQLERKIEGFPEQKEQNPKTAYYPLIQKSLNQKYQAKYLKIVYQQLQICVESILNHPNTLDYLKNLDSKSQIDLFNQYNNYNRLFEELGKIAKISLSVNLQEPTYHSNIIIELLQNKLPILLGNIIRKRFQNRFESLIQSTNISEIQEFKITDFQTLCQHKELKFGANESVADFITVFQNDYNRDFINVVGDLDFAAKQVKDFNEIIQYCLQYKLLTPVTASYYQKRFQPMAERVKILNQLPLNKFPIEKNKLLKNMSLILFDLANALFIDPRYYMDSVELGSYTLYVQHLLCRMFNIEQRKILLTAQEKHQLDLKFSHFFEDHNRIISLHDTSNILLDPVAKKNLPDTYDRPLTLRMLIGCLQYWRANQPNFMRFQSDLGLSPIYFQLVDVVNRVPIFEIDKELSFNNIQFIKRILGVKCVNRQMKNEPHTFKLAEDLAVDALLNSKSISEMVIRESKTSVTKEPGNFYKKLLQEAKQSCHKDDLAKIKIFIDSISQWEQISPNARYSSSFKLMNAHFKECIFFAREINQLTYIFKEIAKSDLAIPDVIKELHNWTRSLKTSIAKKTVICSRGMLMM